MQLTFIGTGDCAGVPVYNCSCPACAATRDNPQRQRSLSCAHLVTSQLSLLIDAGPPDLGSRFPRDSIDLILLSHFHVDHIYGLFPLRWGRAEIKLPVYGPDDPAGCADLLNHAGILDFSTVMQPFATCTVADLTITPLPLTHSKPCLGYALLSEESRLAWLCDTSWLPLETSDFLKSWKPDIMVLDCTFAPRTQRHPNHNDIAAAVALHEEIAPVQTYLTHISHDLDHWLLVNGNSLPENIQVASDNLMLSF